MESVEDAGEFARSLGLSDEAIYLLVHSGLRGFGEAILREHVERFGFAALEVGSRRVEAYLKRHDHAVSWAAANRELIASRMLKQLGAEGRRQLDVCHNGMERQEVGGRACWIHRKGAAPSTRGALVIPGPRGAFSYLVRPVEPGERSCYSLAHGAGRKWTRTDSRARLARRFTVKNLARTELGSHVICEDRELLYEEAPQKRTRISRW